MPVSLVDALEEALRHLAGLDDDRPELPRHVHDVGLGRAHHPSQALLMQGNVTVMWPIHITLRRYFAHHFSFSSLVDTTYTSRILCQLRSKVRNFEIAALHLTLNKLSSQKHLCCTANFVPHYVELVQQLLPRDFSGVARISQPHRSDHFFSETLPVSSPVEYYNRTGYTTAHCLTHETHRQSTKRYYSNN